MPNCPVQWPRQPLARETTSSPGTNWEGAWVGAGAVPGTRAPLVPNGGPEGAVRPAPRLRRRPLAPRVGPAGLRGPAAAAKAGRRGQAGRGGAEPGPSGALGPGQPGWEFGGERWRAWGCSSRRAPGTRTPRAGPCCCWASCNTCTACPGATSAGSCSPGSPRR